LTKKFFLSLSGFGRADPQYKIHEAEVLEATQTLFSTVIPNFVKRFSQLNFSFEQQFSIKRNLIREIHRDGNFFKIPSSKYFGKKMKLSVFQCC
jgi:transcription elongation factor